MSTCAGAAVRVLWLCSMHKDVDISEGQQTALSWSVTAASARCESRRFLSVPHCTVSLNQSPGGARRCVCEGGGGGGKVGRGSVGEEVAVFTFERSRRYRRNQG